LLFRRPNEVVSVNQMIIMAPPPLPPEPRSVPVTFSGDRGEFRRLVTRGALLELVTVGFYRFWLATDMRRHLWSRTSIDGDYAEYTGRGKELLVGFLFALAILVPIYLAYFLVGLEAERIKAFASTPLFVFFYLFGQFAIYRARRYRLTRTVWRGVRFWMTGSGWAYAFRAALWGLLMPLTFGLILPWRDAALERYKMRHSFYGDLQGSFEGTGGDLFKRGWWLWLLAIVSVIALPFSSILGGLPLLVLPLLPFIYAGFKAVQWKWWLSGIRFGGVRLESNLPKKALVGLYWKVIGWSLLLVAGFALYLAADMKIASLAYGISIDALFKSLNSTRAIPVVAFAAIGYLMLALAFNVVIRVYLVRDLWARVSETVSVHGIDATAAVTARGDLASALGEGFADSLDVAGF
jgi:uncharacterized membrane protein YjgN (DUF898 family)